MPWSAFHRASRNPTESGVGPQALRPGPARSRPYLLPSTLVGPDRLTGEQAGSTGTNETGMTEAMRIARVGAEEDDRLEAQALAERLGAAMGAATHRRERFAWAAEPPRKGSSLSAVGG